MFWIIQGFAFSKNENTVKFSQHQNRTGCNLIFNFVVVVILEDSLVYFKAVCLQQWSKKKKRVVQGKPQLSTSLDTCLKMPFSEPPSTLCLLKITGWFFFLMHVQVWEPLLWSSENQIMNINYHCTQEMWAFCLNESSG